MIAIAQWGNSLALRLPKAIAQAAGLKSGICVGVRLLDNGCVLITPVKEQLVVAGGQTLNSKPTPPENW